MAGYYPDVGQTHITDWLGLRATGPISTSTTATSGRAFQHPAKSG